MSQVERVLALLRSRPEGVNTAQLQEKPVLDGGAPILRLAARVLQLREQGFTISSQRQSNGTAQYILVGEPEVFHPNRMETPSPAEAHLFDSSTFTERRSYEDEAA